MNFDCGEIDYIGYHTATQMIALFEFKMVETGFDAHGIRQVRSKFLEGKKCYLNVFAKKQAWVRDNLESMKKLMMERFRIAIPPETNLVGSAFITYYPSLGNLFFNEPPCKSLAQFVDDFRLHGGWPY